MPTSPPDRGPFLGFLDWLNEAGEVPLNVLRGRPGAAGRKAVDFLGDTVDAAIPGDWIPHVSEPDDSVTASDVAGIDRHAHPAWAKAIDTIGGTVVNPLSYLGLRGGAIRGGIPLTEGTAIPGSAVAIGKAKGLYQSARSKLPDSVNSSIDATTHGIRKTLNWLDVPDETMAALKQARAAGYQSSRVGMDEATRIYSGLSGEERIAAGKYASGVQGTGVYSAVDHSPEGLDAYLSTLNPSNTMRPDSVRQAIQAHRSLMANQLKELRGSKAFNRNFEGPDLPDYMQRQYADAYFEEPSLFGNPSSGKTSAIRSRNESLKTPEQLADFLTKTPEAGLEFDILKADMRRSAQQGRIVEKQKIAEYLEPRIKKSLADAASKGDAEAAKQLASLNNGISISDPSHNSLVRKAIDAINKSNKDEGYRLANAWRGVPGRGEDIFSQTLNKANRLFKAGATGGAMGIPRPGFTVRNRVGNATQVLTNDDLRSTFFNNVKNIPRDLAGSFDDMRMAYAGNGAKRWAPDGLSAELDHVEQAFKQSGGDTDKLRSFIAQHPNGAQLQAALDNGVLDNFVSAEGLIQNNAKSDLGKRLTDISNAPSAASQGAEHRMRMQAFKDAKDKGFSDADAARLAREVNLDYDVPGVANRRFRDAVPFGAFLSQNIKQQSKFLARHPVGGVAAAQLFNDDEQMPKYPWLERNISVPTGVDEKGNPNYITSFGLPIEGMATIPGFSKDDLYRDVVGNLQPLAKSALAYAANKDPFTGQAYGQYDKLFGEHAGAIGRTVNNIKGTGLVQSLSGPLDQAQQMTSDKTGFSEKALQYLTGTRFVSVDPELANQQKLEEYLANHPEVKRSVQPYLEKGTDNQELMDVIHELRLSKQRSREHRKLAAPL